MKTAVRPDILFYRVSCARVIGVGKHSGNALLDRRGHELSSLAIKKRR